MSTVDPSQLPSDISKIKNLDFSKSEDQDIFLDYARNFLKTYKGISETELDYSNAENIVTLHRMKDGSYSDTVLHTISIIYNFLFAFAMAHSDSQKSLISKFFNNEVELMVHGPGRDNKWTKEFKDLLSIKEDFVKYHSMPQQIQMGISFELLHSFLLREQQFLLKQNAIQIMADNRLVTEQQTQELKKHNEYLQKQTETQVKSLEEKLNELNTAFHEAQEKLKVFYDKERKREEDREKRRHRIKRRPTSPVSLNIFISCLDGLKTNKQMSDVKIFTCARDRISIFLLFFSGIRVNMLSNFSFKDLAIIFGKKIPNVFGPPELSIAESAAAIPVSKKRHSEQQVLTVAKPIHKEYLYSNHNLHDDLLALLNRLKDWCQEKQVDFEQNGLDFAFYTSFNDLSKSISRENINKNINKVLRNGVQDSSSRVSSLKLLNTYTSHSFRYYIATSIIADTGDIRKAQQFLHHSSVATTALYDRNVLTNETIRAITNRQANPKTDKQKIQFSEEQVLDFATRVASNKAFSDTEIQKIEKSFENGEDSLNPDRFHEKAQKTQRHVDHKNEARKNKFVKKNKNVSEKNIQKT